MDISMRTRYAFADSRRLKAAMSGESAGTGTPGGSPAAGRCERAFGFPPMPLCRISSTMFGVADGA